MIIDSLRDVFTPTTTLSAVSVVYDGRLAYGPAGWRADAPRGPLPFGFLCEDEDRGLLRSWGEARCRAAKVRRETAIAATEGSEDYLVTITHSPKYAERIGADGRRLCPDGRMMLINGVWAFSGVRCHPGTDESDTDACLLPGLRRDVRRGFVYDSTLAYRWLDARVRECEARGEAVYWRIRRDAAAWDAFQAAGGAAGSRVVSPA